MTLSSFPRSSSTNLRWWSLSVVDAFRGKSSHRGVPDPFSYASGRFEGEVAREQGRTADEVLENARVPYREKDFRQGARFRRLERSVNEE
jgi:hypothetical protein